MSPLRKRCNKNKVGMEEIRGGELMAIYEVLQDIDVRENDKFVHYYGRRVGHRGQLIDEHNIKPEHLEYIKDTIDILNKEIKCGAADYKIADLVRLIRLEREIMGGQGREDEEGLLSAEEIRDLEGRSKASDTERVPPMQRR